MAGFFYVFWGTKDKGFQKPEVVKGSDGSPLEIQVAGEGNANITEKICTKPAAGDIDGDGHLDLVVGTFAGTFYLFKGEGKGKFSPKSVQMEAHGETLKVPHHSDPVLVDWDADGDLDLVSGADGGGVYLCVNEGTKTSAKFRPPAAIVPAIKRRSFKEVRFGDDFLTGPQASTRVCVDDVNGDGKLDLIVGDNVTLTYPREGLDEARAREKYAAWMKEQQALFEKEVPDFETQWKALLAKRDQIVTVDSTGFVWVMYQK